MLRCLSSCPVHAERATIATSAQRGLIATRSADHAVHSFGTSPLEATSYGTVHPSDSAIFHAHLFVHSSSSDAKGPTSKPSLVGQVAFSRQHHHRKCVLLLSSHFLFLCIMRVDLKCLCFHFPLDFHLRVDNLASPFQRRVFVCCDVS